MTLHNQVRAAILAGNEPAVIAATFGVSERTVNAMKAALVPKSNAEQAAEALVRLGLDGLNNPHGMIGRSCGCGTCFCCEAYKLVLSVKADGARSFPA